MKVLPDTKVCIALMRRHVRASARLLVRAPGRLRHLELEKMGGSCGPYDLLLAGHALALALPLATHNVREFARIEGLRVDDWLL